MAKASLKGRNITSMNDYMEDIVTKNPASLDLSSNKLAALPDMSSLRSLTELNVPVECISLL